MCEVDKEAISGEMCLEENQYSSALVVAINFYSKSHTKRHIMTVSAAEHNYSKVTIEYTITSRTSSEDF